MPDSCRPAVFLDRDGVLNRPVVRSGLPYSPRTVDQFELYPGAVDACDRLRALGFALVVVTNQPDVARGTVGIETVDAIHGSLRSQISVQAVYVCPHDDSDGCACRKPEPGLLVKAAVDLSLSLPHSIMVGDRWRDVEAGRRAGCRTVHIDRRYTEQLPVEPDATVGSLEEAVRWIEEFSVFEGITNG